MTFEAWVEAARELRDALHLVGVTSERVIATIRLRSPADARAALAELVAEVETRVPDIDAGPRRRVLAALRALEVVPLRVRWQPELARLNPKTDDARCLLLALAPEGS